MNASLEASIFYTAILDFTSKSVMIITNKIYSSLIDLGCIIIFITINFVNLLFVQQENNFNTNIMRRDHNNAATCHHYSPNTSFVIGLVFMSCLVILLLLPMASFAFRTTSFTNILSFSKNKLVCNNDNNNNHDNQNQISNDNSCSILKRQLQQDITSHNTPTKSKYNIISKPNYSPQSSSLHSLQGSFKNVLNEVSSMFEERHSQVRKVLEDFSQPFFGFIRPEEEEEHDDDCENDEEKYSDDDNDSHLETIVVEGSLFDIDTRNITNVDDENTMTHFCFLVHGDRGKPADLLYLRSAMADTAEKIFLSKSSTTSITESDDKMNLKANKHRIILHSCQSNWNRTSDGIEAGGERIFNEILKVIRSSIDELQQNDGEIIDVTMSLIGNSLGGLYSRYAISKLATYSSSSQDNVESKIVNNSMNETDPPSVSKETILIDGKIRIHFNTFCTTATPHLGVSGHTWLPLPRSAEVGIGSLMGQTGKDIFRMSTLIKTMCTEELFLKPLGSFRKRIAYANGYHTDFVVSTKTAAFLHPESTIPHTMSEQNLAEGQQEDFDINSENISSNHNGMVVATLYTQSSREISNTPKSMDEIPISAETQVRNQMF